MKRILSIMLLCFVLIGCAKSVDPTEPPVLNIIQTDPVTTPELTETAGEALVSFSVYLPNDNADGFVVHTVESSQIDGGSVLATLQAYGVLPETVVINDFSSRGEELHIDFNEVFGQLVSSTGTSGERMIVGSVVNTYLSAFQAGSLSFTVNGEILESGHVIYDFPITFME